MGGFFFVRAVYSQDFNVEETGCLASQPAGYLDRLAADEFLGATHSR